MKRIVLALALAGLVGGSAVSEAVAQGARRGAETPYKAPRGPGGKPDLNGVWQVMNHANYDIEPHAARAALAFRPGPFGPVPAKEVLALGAVGAVPAGLGVVEGGVIPYKPEALAKRNENRDKWLERDPEIKCYLPGVPRANYMHLPFQIFHSDKSMLFAYEYAGAVRNILFQDPGPPPVDSWMGQSVAKWEGDTLVVTVTGQLDSTWFDRAGNHHSATMTVTERYTPTGPNVMRYEATIDDPETFTRPWKMSMNLYRRVGEDARLQQFKCVEFVEELMYGHLRKEPLP
ncbi:hypothetical protein [Phenylobacterium sp.]|jgi:hypothetical protein|uniref:hypothetical protein n=1 Tax=Phenylobacterium sp. TaxID=1871053 RepID=UPI002E3746D9|nr:hypothetical protein [Phenylobacterium sp.]HEX2559489.1 hypothetical protein [Phenylobacterium sp.]